MLKQGYIHIKGCYPEAWVKHLETLIKTNLGNEALKLAMEDNTTVLVAKSLCGLEPLQTGENQYNDVKDASGLYDAPHRDYPFTQSHVPVYRFAIYMQDYKDTEDGSIWFINSCRTIDIVKPSPGDLVVWSLSTPHAARHSDLFPRRALFFDYGADCPELHGYVQWRKGKKK